MTKQRPKYEIPEDAPARLCSEPTCRAVIYWIARPNGKKLCVNVDGSSHWDTCTRPDRFSKRGKSAN